MRNKYILILSIIFLVFSFTIFYKGLNNEILYVPNQKKQKQLISFNSKNFLSENVERFEEVFDGSQFYVLNIWSSWCLPCKEEHPILMELNKNPKVKIIGLNYKDKKENALKFIRINGNPYNIILEDKKGIISIELGAYGVPETFLVNNEKKILKKFIGPLNRESLNKIMSIIK